MKNLSWLGVAVLVGIVTVGCAQAADMGQQNAPPAPSGAPAWLSWTGIYVGTHVGTGWATTEWNTFSSLGSPDAWKPLGSSSFLSGGQIGGNWQSGRFVIGIEANASALDHGSGPCIVSGCGTKTIGTLTGRIGTTVDHTLFYIQGGAGGLR